MGCNKKKYGTKEEASKVISNAWSGKATWRGKTLPMRYYKCKNCNAWHLTSKPLKTAAQLASLHHHNRGMV